MALFCAAIGRGSVSLLRFIFCSHVHVVSRAISPVCHLKYPYSCLSSHFSFIVFVIFVYIYVANIYQLIGQVGRVFANGLGDLGSIQGRVIPKTLKMVLDTSLLNTQQYKVRIKAKVKQSRERSSALPYTSV